MIDGILDLLAAILVLGIVVAVAFGFILPLTDNDIMQYNISYEDKALLNTITDYSDENEYKNVMQRKYSFEELVLLMYVQDNRMPEPKGINLRNLVNTSMSLNSVDTNNLNLNLTTPVNADMGTLNTIRYFSDNPSDPNNLLPSNELNIGTIMIGTNYPLNATNLANTFATSNKIQLPGIILDKDNIGFKQENKNNVFCYSVDYMFAIPEKNKEYITSVLSRNYDDTPTYMVNILLKDTNDNVVLDTLNNNLNYIKDLQENLVLK